MKKIVPGFTALTAMLAIFCLCSAPLANAAAADRLKRKAQSNESNFLARINFNPKVNGFGFRNYTNSSHRWQDDLNVEDMILLFGAGAVCSKGSTAKDCVMKAAAREWMMQVLENMNIGHCDGMATTSLLLATKRSFKGKTLPSQFQTPAQKAFDLKLDQTMENFIAYFWATQTLQEIRSQRTKFRTDGPVAVVKTLIDSLKTGKDAHTLIFWKFENGKLTAGHVVSPFAVEDAGAVYRIHVYDNNYPGQTRHITVEKEGKQTWKYVTTVNPQKPVSPYTGDITTKSLSLTSNSQREKGCFKAPFATDGKGAACVPVKQPPVPPSAPRKPIEYTAPKRPAKPAAPVKTFKPDPVFNANLNVKKGAEFDETYFFEGETAEFALNGDADLLVIDGEGYAMGYDPAINQMVDEIPFSEIGWQAGGRGFDTPLYRLPYQHGGAPYTILISGRNIGQRTNVDLTYSAPGLNVGFDGIWVDPNEIISMTISPDGEQLSFTSSNDGETPEIYFAADLHNKSVKFEIDGAKLKPGKTLTVSYNPQNQLFNFYDNDGDDDKYDVDFVRYNADGTVWYYETDDIDFGTNDRYQMDFSKWNGEGAVGVSVDEEGDGFDDDEYVMQENEDNDLDADDADDEGDDEDSDIDNDGKLNADDADDDNDGIPDDKDSDDDNDGLSDSEDADCEDDDGDGTPDDDDEDDDNDGTPDDEDADDDNDGTSDAEEDGEYDEEEEIDEGEYLNENDIDGDGVANDEDDDDDGDGIPDNEDDDDDNDGEPDEDDPEEDTDGETDDDDPESADDELGWTSFLARWLRFAPES